MDNVALVGAAIKQQDPQTDTDYVVNTVTDLVIALQCRDERPGGLDGLCCGRLVGLSAQCSADRPRVQRSGRSGVHYILDIALKVSL